MLWAHRDIVSLQRQDYYTLFQTWREAGSEAAGAMISDSLAPGVLPQVESELPTLWQLPDSESRWLPPRMFLAFANTIKSNCCQEWCAGLVTVWKKHLSEIEVSYYFSSREEREIQHLYFLRGKKKYSWVVKFERE